MDNEAERVARLLCKFDGGDPDMSLGGDKQNFLWMEYERQAQGLIDAGKVIVPREPTETMQLDALEALLAKNKERRKWWELPEQQERHLEEEGVLMMPTEALMLISSEETDAVWQAMLKVTETDQ